MAAELVGGALLSAFLQVAVDRLASYQVLDFFRVRKLDETLLSKLNIKLLSIDALADDAEQKQFRDPRVKAWLFAVKDVVLDAEDLLDDIDYELSKCELEAESESQTFTYKVSNFFNATFSSFNRKIDSGMKQVLDKLEYLASQKGDLGLKETTYSGVGSGSKVLQKLPSTSLVVESVIYGRDDDKEMIFNWLTSETDNHNQLSILSVVGMGGLGKTMLAQHVYNDPRIEEADFGIKAWVCVSDDFDVLRVTRSILEAITKSKDDSGDLESVHGRLKENLTGKRFLLVLDDVWNEKREKWEAVQTPLNYGARGSRILVTTRSEKVASTVRSNKVHRLMQLQEDHCWQVFAKHAFQDDNSQLNVELEEIGKKIVEKCKGLPLALKTIGSLLHTKSSVSEWESILISKIWDLPKEDSEIIPALFLSYHHLPSHLKRCFAYCALFPKDYVFVKERLILLWMAENFLQCPQQSKSPEEVGEQYFNDLLWRSFFQQSTEFESLNCFVMHDLLNDLAKYVCGDICFRLGVDKAKHIPKTTRHFSFDEVQYFDGFGSLHDAKRLRTFMPTSGGMFLVKDPWQCKISIHELFSKFMFLRILSLSYCVDLIEVPDSVGDLRHLRSLDLSGTDIKKLPNSTCFLYNLQTLKLNFCRNLDELPSNLHKLTNLRCLEFLNTKVRKMPMHFGKLKNLQEVNTFCVGKSSEFSMKLLGGLNLHGGISIQELQNIVNPSDALAADLKNKTHLRKLRLQWYQEHIADDPRKEREVLENLQPSIHLKNLLICNYGGTQFPSWLFDNSLSNVVLLVLENCKYCLCLPPLGLLPFLKKLRITGLDGVVSIGAEFNGSIFSSFKSLETLYFSHMKEWEEWECKAAFPRLQSFTVRNCPKLKGNLPEQLLHIKDLDVNGCGMVTISGLNVEASSLERIEHTVSNTSLEALSICSYPNTNIPMKSCYNFLETLWIKDGCDSLTTFPLDFFPKLRTLRLKRCCNLQMISQEHIHNHLEDLVISKCPQFESFPSEGLFASRLRKFSIKNLENLKLLPKHMHILLPSLTYLSIEECPQVEMFSDGGLPSNLESMDLSNCFKFIASLKGALGDNTSLKFLSIGKVDVESFPDEGFLPLSLASLGIHGCAHLKKMDYKGLCHLSSLEKLVLYDCPSLQCFPEEDLSKTISTLYISGCPLLEQRCQKPEGEDWRKIAHIENLEIKADTSKIGKILKRKSSRRSYLFL